MSGVTRLTRGLFSLPLLWLLAPGPAGAQDSTAGTASSGPETPPAQTLRDFRLSPGDVIKLKFFYNPELSDTVQIRPDGRIALALVGEVELRKRTIPEATQLLEELYAPHVRVPSLAIQVETYAAQKVYVGGEVLRPGTVSLLSDLSVLDAIMEAGGPRPTGSKTTVILIRRGEDDAPVMQRLALRERNEQPSAAASLRLRPFDVILVPETRIARIDRWVDQYIRQLIPLTLNAGFTYLFNENGLVLGATP